MKMKYSNSFLDACASAYKDAIGKGKNDTAKYLLHVFSEIGVIRHDGGPGSGNWGHEGRPGEVGGSAEGGGSHNRIELESGGYTSFSKQRTAFAKEHKIGPEDIKIAGSTKGCVVISGEHTYNYYASQDDRCYYQDQRTGMLMVIEDLVGQNARVIIPDTASKNYMKLKPHTQKELLKKISSANRPESAREADDLYREKSGEVWASLDKSSKSALVEYTSVDYVDINGFLRSDGSMHKSFREYTRYITDAIKKSTLDEDAVFFRGLGTKGFERMVGIPMGSLTPDNVGDLVGRCPVEKGFMSCGTIEGTGFSHKDVQLEILAPKGTMALYAEPFSDCGNGSGINWNGESLQDTFSGELETLVQQGTRIGIVSAEYKYGTYHIKAAIMSQKPKKY